MTANHDQQAADRLYAFLKGELPADAPDLPRAEAELAGTLKATAQHIQPGAEFEAALEQRLTQPPKAPRRGIFSSQSFSGLGQFLAWGTMAAALLFGLVWIFQNVLPRSGPAAVTPVVEATATPLPTAVTPTPVSQETVAPPPTAVSTIYNSPIADSGLMLNTEFPVGSESVQVYQQVTPEMITIERAREIAGRLGIDGPVYLAPFGEPASTTYYLTDGVMEIVFNGYSTWFDYHPVRKVPSQFTPSNTAPETLIAEAESFLKAANLLDFTYQAKISPVDGSVQFVQTLDDLPVEVIDYGSTVLQVGFDQDGKINSIMSTRSAYQALGSYPILSAEQAWQKLTSEKLIGGAQMYSSYSQSPAPEADYLYWQREYQPGQQVEIFGYLTRYKPAEPGFQPLVLINGYPLTGKATTESTLIELTTQQNYMHVWGTFETGDNGQLALNVSGYQKSTFAHNTLIGTLTRQDGKAYLHTEDDQQVLLPDLPADVPEGVKLMVDGTLVPDPEPTMVWATISNGEGGGGGGGGGGMGFAELNLSGEALPPTETPPPAPSAPVQPKQRVEGAQGSVNVIIHQFTDGVRQSQASLILDPTPEWPDGLVVELKGPATAGIDAYHEQPVKVWGSFQTPAGSTPELWVERIEPVYPDSKPKAWFGTVDIVTIDGRGTMVFTDQQDNQEYVLANSNVDGMTVDQLPWPVGATMVVEGMLVPGQNVGGYPLINNRGILPFSGDPSQYEAMAVSPPVIQEPAASTEVKLATVDKIELIYMTDNPHTYPSGQDGVIYVQPMWRFTGHYNSGQGFEILVQALDPKYLK